MRLPILSMMVALLFGLVLSLGAAGQEKKSLKPTQRWGGKSDDEDKKKAAPKSGYLTTQDSFEKLWTAWGVKGEAPKIDFTKQIVFVQFAGGPNPPASSYSLDRKGNLTVEIKQTLLDGPGYGFGIDVLDREGIKTYNGKPLEK
jgi:hypothetical protein